MKLMRSLFATSVLVSVLSVSPFAGNMHTGAPQPDPPPATTEEEQTAGVDGDIHTGYTDEATADAAVAEAALSLLQGVLSLL